MKNHRILVIGATGLLGTAVAKQFKTDGFVVRVFVRSKEKFEVSFNEGYEMAEGDVFDKSSLEKAIEDCSAIHISLSNVDDAAAARNILEVARKYPVKKIGLVTGATVSEKNAWFWMMKQKLEAENLIKESGIPYIIFKPSWFYDTLPRFIRKGRASVIGKQTKKFHWMAAKDFAGMVSAAFQSKELVNEAFYCFGPEVYTMKEALEAYCKLAEPNIKKVGEAPVWLMKLIAALSGNTMLKSFTQLSVYFTKVDEPPVDNKTWELLGKPETTMAAWVASGK